MNNPAEWFFFLFLLFALPGLFGFLSLRLIHYLVSKVRDVMYRSLILPGLIVINWVPAQ